MPDPARYPEFEPGSPDPDERELTHPAAGGFPAYPVVDYGAGGAASADPRAEDDVPDEDEAVDEPDADEDGSDPVGEAPEATGDADETDGDDGDEEDEDDELPSPGVAARMIAGAGTAAKGATAAARRGFVLARRYPRAGLAAGLSAAILGGVIVLRPGHGARDTTAAIPNPDAQHQAQNAGEGAAEHPKPTPDKEPTPPTPPVAQARPNDPAPGPDPGEGEKPVGPKTDDLAGAELPALPAGNDPAPAPAAAPTLEVKAEPVEAAPDPAPAPAPALASAADHVKLTAGEKSAPPGLDPIEDPDPKGKDADKELAAPPLTPVGDLAVADVKPGTPPAAGEAPAPAPAPATAPAPGPEIVPLPAPEAPNAGPADGPGKTPTADPAPAPAPVPAPARAPSPAAGALAGAAGGAAAGALVGAAGSNAPAPPPAPPHDPPASTPAPAPAPTPALSPAADPRPAPTEVKAEPPKAPGADAAKAVKGVAEGAAGAAAKGGTAKAAIVAGGLGAVTGAAISALSHGDKNIEKEKPAAGDKPATEKPAAVPQASPTTAAHLAEPKPVEAKPQPTQPVTPAPASGPEPKAVPAPASAPEHAVPPVAAAGAAVGAAALPALHPAGDPGPGNPPPAAEPEPPHAAPNAPAAPASIEPAEPRPRDPLADQGWVPIQHAGNESVRDVQRDLPGPDDEAPAARNAGPGASEVDPAAPAEREPSFDVESPPIRINTTAAAGARAGSGQAAEQRDRPWSGRDEGKLDTVLHKVEPNENFWTISRMYYSSGRYYKALWKANADRVPKIDQLHVDTVIRVPPPEDLDPAFIDPPGTRASKPKAEPMAGRGDETDPAREATADATPAPAPRRTARGDGVPIRRSNRSDADLTLPVSDAAVADGDGSARSKSRARAIDFRDDREPEARPRDAVARPIYKVRPYDTLRSIARDTLGDARRADEVLELNRDIIDDPSHLIVGQLLELPEDARAIRPRSRR